MQHKFMDDETNAHTDRLRTVWASISARFDNTSRLSRCAILHNAYYKRLTYRPLAVCGR